jgi:WD40 repeat protein
MTSTPGWHIWIDRGGTFTDIVAISPDGTHVVTAMQENALHGWRLADGQHMRMSGYPSKTHFLSFTARGKWLATSGADAVVVWPFFGGGPMGKAPTELAGGDGVLVSAVACHPQHEVVAAGFADGLVLLAEIGSGKVVPVAAPPGNSFRVKSRAPSRTRTGSRMLSAKLLLAVAGVSAERQSQIS